VEGSIETESGVSSSADAGGRLSVPGTLEERSNSKAGIAPGSRGLDQPSLQPVVLLAGDKGHSRAVSGRSKAFVELAGRTMLEHVLEAILEAPELGDVYIVGDAPRIQKLLVDSHSIELAARKGRVLHVLPQRASLYENVWHAFLASLPVGPLDPDRSVLVVPADIPLVIAPELSAFIRAARAEDVDYVLGLTPDVALAPFAPRDGRPGIEMACFNLREGRLRQNNLHLVRPLRMASRHYIQNMYESRYQKELGSIVRLALQLLVRELRHAWFVFPYFLLHVGGVLDRRGHVAAADAVRRWISLRTVEYCIGALLRTRFRTVITGFGGAALDVDNDHDLAAAEKMWVHWRSLQTERADAAMLDVR